MRRLLILFSLAAVVGLLAFGAASVVGLLDDDPSPGPTGARVFPQGSSAVSGGVTLTLVRSTFSGTETLLEFAAYRGSENLGANFVIPPAALAVDSMFDSARPGGGTHGEDGTLFVEMPPLNRPGDATVTVKELRVGAPASRWEVVRGPWTLALQGPTASEFDALMRVEELTSATLDVQGQRLTVTGRRSTSRTIVEYTALAGLEELKPPQIIGADGQPLLPFTYGV
ncbi:MAG: hypothetical protein IT304_02470 [Dehalococcoidia bacterium]|nr:hypothetical protein [Dehalococcoidia bacterium]